MQMAFVKNRAFYLNLLAIFLILLVAGITTYFPEWFVYESGQIKIYGLLGILLAIGLWRRWSYARIGAILVTLVGMGALTVASMTTNEFYYQRNIIGILLVMIGILLILLSKPLATYHDLK